MMKVLLDTNIILDIALAREPYFNDSSKVFKLLKNLNSNYIFKKKPDLPAFLIY